MEHFETLYSINVNDKTEKLTQGRTSLTYLSWTWAWAEIKKRYPDATYTIEKFIQPDGTFLPYMYDTNTGYMVMTTVTIEGLTHEMWLPVMDGANKAMKDHEYTYKVKDYQNRGQFIEKSVQPATMFDINKTIMRCLTKNLAMFGLGLYIYAGEDLPEGEDVEKQEKEAKPERKKGEKPKSQNYSYDFGDGKKYPSADETYYCEECGNEVVDTVKANGQPYLKEQCVAVSANTFGKVLCADCLKKRLSEVNVNA